MTTNGIFIELKDGISTALVDTTRTAGQIANEDLAFYRSSNPSVVPLLEQQSTRLLDLARKLLRTATNESEVSVPRFSDADSVEDNWKGIVDVFDNLLEKADACLDEYTGVIRRLSPDQEVKIKRAGEPIGKQRPGKAYRTRNVVKPQLLFEQVPTNTASLPFKPLLQSKPHAIKPFEESLMLISSDDGSTRYGHPYEVEIKALRYPAAIFTASEPIPYLPYEGTAATLVETPEAVALMLQELKLVEAIAVDLEHHDEHSYIGLVSLMQISTRDRDWIVDTLKPWRQELQILNEVFADPKIIKVFHGAYMDMIWLQRDLGLYVVGLFDTYHASRALGYPKHGLAYLLKRFADFDAAKQYQMADWRIRPLPQEMFNYARSDTHFLLHIYDHMRNELIEKSDVSQPEGDLIEVVMNDSKEEALQRYERPRYDERTGSGPIGWFNLLCRTPALFSKEQFAVFRAIHQWRDTLARQEDESVHAVMPKHVLFNIAREMPLDMPSLLGCSHPMSKAFQKSKIYLLEVIKQARLAGATGPEMKNFISAAQSGSTDHVFKASKAKQTTLASIEQGVAVRALDPPSQSDSIARAQESHFWGLTAFGDVTSSVSKIRSNDDMLQLALPMPQLTKEPFEDHKDIKHVVASISHADTGARAEHRYVKDRKPREDDVFVVKQAGGSRKRKTSDFENSSRLVSADGDGIAPNRIATEVIAEQPGVVNAKPRKMKEDKELAKREHKHQTAMDSAQEEAPEELEPFDYASAPSVLHARHNINSSTKGVNPYAKATDAPKGMRKTQKDIEGKSLTFIKH